MFDQDHIFFFHLQRVGEEQGWYCLWRLGRVTEAEDLCIAMEIEVPVRHTLKQTGFPSWGTGKSALAVGVSADPLGPRWVVERKEEDEWSWPGGPTRRVPCFSSHQLFMVLGRSALGR